MFWDVGHRTLLLLNAVHAHSPLGQPCSWHSHVSRGLELRNEWMQWARERAHNFYRKMLRASYSGPQGSVALLKYIFLINFLLSFEWYRSHRKSLPFVIEHYCQPVFSRLRQFSLSLSQFSVITRMRMKLVSPFILSLLLKSAGPADIWLDWLLGLNVRYKHSEKHYRFQRFLLFPMVPLLKKS